jgi:Domain of Unknown Function (DUF928)
MKDSARRGRQGIISFVLACLLCDVLGGYVLPQSAEAQQPNAIPYKPPSRGAPGSREGAGSRGSGGSLPTVVVLTPKDHTGLTIQEQPVLYWYLSQEAQHPVEITLTDRQSVKPLLETRLQPPLQPGMHVVRLADYGIHLTPGVPYKWSVALVPDPTQRSQDVMSAGTIERMALPDELRGQLARADKASAARLYATAGLWYDTIATLSELIDATPRDATLRQQRATLLDQEDLPEAAAYDRQHK